MQLFLLITFPWILTLFFNTSSCFSNSPTPNFSLLHVEYFDHQSPKLGLEMGINLNRRNYTVKNYFRGTFALFENASFHLLLPESIQRNVVGFLLLLSFTRTV